MFSCKSSEYFLNVFYLWFYKKLEEWMTAAKENISEVYIDILQSKHLLFETL